MCLQIPPGSALAFFHTIRFPPSVRQHPSDGVPHPFSFYSPFSLVWIPRVTHWFPVATNHHSPFLFRPLTHLRPFPLILLSPFTCSFFLSKANLTRSLLFMNILVFQQVLALFTCFIPVARFIPLPPFRVCFFDDVMRSPVSSTPRPLPRASGAISVRLYAPSSLSADPSPAPIFYSLKNFAYKFPWIRVPNFFRRVHAIFFFLELILLSPMITQDLSNLTPFLVYFSGVSLRPLTHAAKSLSFPTNSLLRLFNFGSSLIEFFPRYCSNVSR